MAKKKFTDTEKRILALVQGDLPDSAAPFADIAAKVGVDEAEVLSLLAELKENGAIRRFGATLRHQKAGYGFNAMVAWYVESDADLDKVGRIMAKRPEISHCYARKNCLDWPYNLYTMVHGQNPEDCKRLAKELSEQSGVAQYEILQSRKEFKKSSMKYF